MAEENQSQLNKEQELEQQLKRALADYANLQKRFEKEREDVVKFSNEMLMVQLISILDGLEMTIKQFTTILMQAGFEKIEVEPGNDFDAQTMEAVESDSNDGKVTEVYNSAYKLHGKLIRPAKVKVGTTRKEDH